MVSVSTSRLVGPTRMTFLSNIAGWSGRTGQRWSVSVGKSSGESGWGNTVDHQRKSGHKTSLWSKN